MIQTLHEMTTKPEYVPIEMDDDIIGPTIHRLRCRAGPGWNVGKEAPVSCAFRVEMTPNENEYLADKTPEENAFRHGLRTWMNGGCEVREYDAGCSMRVGLHVLQWST